MKVACLNVGGFGQTEEQLVLQSRVRINAGLTLLALGVYTQLALVLKKKQFEPTTATAMRLMASYTGWRSLGTQLEAYSLRACNVVADDIDRSS